MGLNGGQFALKPCGTTASSRGVAVGQLDNPVGEEEAQNANDEFRDAKHEIAQGGGGAGIAFLAAGQKIFKKVVEAAQKVIQGVKDDEKTDGSDDDAKEVGWFHIAADKRIFPRKSIAVSRFARRCGPCSGHRATSASSRGRRW